MSFFIFVVETYERAISSCRRHQFTLDANDNRHLSPHSRHEIHRRVLWTRGHNTHGNIIGPFLPRWDDNDRLDYYYASMLAFWNPWRKLEDLRPLGQSWDQVFVDFVANSN